MQRLLSLRKLEVESSSKNHRGFVAAASGLVCHEEKLYVIADDELELAVFELNPQTEAQKRGRLYALRSGELPVDTRARKKVKPDWESITLMPPSPLHAQGSLLITPSGSTATRTQGIWVGLDTSANPTEPPHPIDFSPLYERLIKEFGELNIEGSVCTQTHLKLLQRGNGQSGINAMIDLDLPRTLEGLRRGRVDAEFLSGIRTYDLGQLHGVRLSFTDLCSLSDGRLLFIAAAEDSPDTFHDGVNQGSVLGLMDSQGDLVWVNELQPQIKAEGIAALEKNGRMEVFIVSDEDNPSQPAELYFCEI